MGFRDEKYGNAKYSASPVSPNGPMSAVSRTSYASLAEFEKKDLKYKKRIRILRFISRFLSLILNAGMIGILSYALAKYYLTKNKIIQGNVHPWITPATLWPSFMLLGISAVTFLMNLITLCSYICGINPANKTYSCTSYVVYAMTGLHVVVWGFAIGAFRMGRTESSLWGFSCSDRADALQPLVQSYLNYGKLCTMQNGAWGVSILEGVTYFLTFVVTIMTFRRASTKKKMAKVRESLAMESGYNQQGFTQESGTVYNATAGKRYMPVSVESPHV